MSHMIERLKKLHQDREVKASFVACRLQENYPGADKDWQGKGKLNSEKCGICDRGIWASDTSMEMKKGLGSKLICDDCAYLESAGENSITVMTKEAAESCKADSGSTDEEMVGQLKKWQKLHGTKNIGGIV